MLCLVTYNFVLWWIKAIHFLPIKMLFIRRVEIFIDFDFLIPIGVNISLKQHYRLTQNFVRPLQHTMQIISLTRFEAHKQLQFNTRRAWWAKHHNIIYHKMAFMRNACIIIIFWRKPVIDDTFSFRVETCIRHHNGYFLVTPISIVNFTNQQTQCIFSGQ